MPPRRHAHHVHAHRRSRHEAKVATTHMAKAESAGMQPQGLLHMPSSWLHQLIISLPRKDRLSLFQTCRQLSRHVMVSSPTASLHLLDTPNWEHTQQGWWILIATLAMPVMVLLLMRILVKWCSQNFLHSSLAQALPVVLLLSVGCNVMIQMLPFWWAWRRSRQIVYILAPRRHLHLALAGTYIIPSALYPRVSVLELRGYKPVPPFNRLPWHTMTSLNRLAIMEPGMIPLQHFQRALLANHLSKLQQLELYPGSSWPEDSAWADPGFAETIADKLGPRLVHLASSSQTLWLQLQRFTALKSVVIGPACVQADARWQTHMKIPADVMSHLCEHPTLRSVTLRACILDEACQPDTQLSCNWSILVMDFTHPRALAAFSLSSLKEIRFVSGLPFSNATLDVQQPERVITGHSFSITCGSDGFFLAQLLLSRQTTQLIAHFTGLHTLRLHSTYVGIPDSLSQLWVDSPASVHSLELCEATGQLEQSLWQGMPDTIQDVWLNACNIETEALAAILRTAPAHVCSIRLTPRRKVELKQWEDAGVSSSAPVHVTVQLCTAT